MTDPTLTEQLEIENAETATSIQEGQPEEKPTKPAAHIKAYYKPNRKDRRRAAAIARKAHKQHQK